MTEKYSPQKHEYGTPAGASWAKSMTPGQETADMPHGKEKKKVKGLKEHMDIQESVIYHLENDIPLGELYRVGSMRYYQVFNEARELYNEGKLNLNGANLWFVESDIGYFAEYKGEMVPLDSPMIDEEDLDEGMKSDAYVVALKDPKGWKVSFKGSKSDRAKEFKKLKDAGKKLGVDYVGYMSPGRKIGDVIKEEDEKQPELNKPKAGGPKKYYVYVKDPSSGNIKKVSWGDTTGLKIKLNDPEARKSFAARHDCANKKDKTKPGYWACRMPYFAKQLGLSGGGSFFW